MKLAHHDFETHSIVDLRVCGADVYAEHPSTGVLCLGYTLADEPPTVWNPSQPDPAPLLRHIAAGGPLACWNSAFEEAIWAHVIPRRFPHWPRPKPEQFHDVMAWALAAALPGALEDCAPAMGLDVVKDEAGSRVMKQVMKPRAVDGERIVWWHECTAEPKVSGKFERLYAYCGQDVVVERAIAKKLRPLSPAERQVWLLDRRINRRGVLLDDVAIAGARRIAQHEAARLNAEMAEVTCGAVKAATNVAELTQFVRDAGVRCDGVAKGDIRELLDNPSTPDDVKASLRIRQEAGKASTAKLTKMLAGRSRDGRARDLFQYHGSTTGRWAGRRVQPQNMPRPELSAAEVAECVELFPVEHGADMIRTGYGAPLDVLSWSLRGMFVPAKGSRFLGGDFANIEGRVLAWLAGELWKLDAFTDYDNKTGPDLYKVAYARAFDLKPEQVSKDQRQIGKVMELALGYQGGIGAFRSMAKNYNADLQAIADAVERATPAEQWARAESKRLLLQIEHGQHADLPPQQYTALRVLVDAWRTAHPAIKGFWADIESAAMSAVKNRGQLFPTQMGLIQFNCGRDFLYMRLPSGRVLSYARPDLVWRLNEITEKQQLVLQYFAQGKDRENQGKKQFEAVTSYGGLLAENATQAVARDVLVEAMIRMEAAGYPIVLHVHDEARAEVPYGRGSLAECERLMSELPRWAAGLPVAVECDEMTRYHK